jgi:hypothetical protein
MIDPRGLEIHEWADFVIPLVSEYGTVGRLDIGADWKAWALQIASLTEMQKQGVPSPNEFADWKDWAYQFFQIFDRGL